MPRLADKAQLLKEIQLGVAIDTQLNEKLRIAAFKNNTSKSEILRRAAQEYFERYPEQGSLAA